MGTQQPWLYVLLGVTLLILALIFGEWIWEFIKTFKKERRKE